MRLHGAYDVIRGNIQGDSKIIFTNFGGGFLAVKQGKMVRAYMFANNDQFHDLRVHPTSILWIYLIVDIPDEGT